MSYHFEQINKQASASAVTTAEPIAEHPDTRLKTTHSLSVVLPAYNEEHVIVMTVRDVLTRLDRWGIDYEIIVINDGSKDRTAALVAEISAVHPQVRLINHATNQGYGAALVSGFAAASKSLTFFFARLRPTLIINSNSWLRSAIVAGVAVLLITPAIWSFTTALHPENTTLPTAGPSTMGGMMAFPGADGGSMSSKYRTGSFSSTDSKGRAGGPPAGFGGMGMGGGAASDQKLIDYLTANQGTARYLLATIRSTSAESIIVQTNKPVMALGGYLGSDPILTQSQLTSLIKDGTVRYFLLQSPGNPNTTTDASPTQASGPTGTGQMRGNGGGGLLGAGQNQQLTGWVQSHCSIVQASLWSTSSTQSNTAAGGGSDVGGQQLYDCSSLH